MAKLKAVPEPEVPDRPPNTRRFDFEGETFDIEDMTGEDYLLLRAIQIKQGITQRQLDQVMAMMRDRVVSSSVPVLSLKVPKIFALSQVWFSGKEEEALPNQTATT